ncbi:cytochrome c [Mariprofundus sp. EBB-1]|uniref:c-type cytochrome n=1 Tax=Mariprofundus sp. EBB-1 TaxID=2650971 RepID=UPI0011C3DD7F|nr:cytochrome c [Mariprofundus sp. EBB-1]
MRKVMMILLFSVILPGLACAEIPDANSPDAQVYANHCASCHVLPHPGRLDWQGWRNMLYLMEKRMEERGVDKPTAEQWQAIARYVKSHAR